MNVKNIIEELTQEIAVRQDLLGAIHKFRGVGGLPALVSSGRTANPYKIKVTRKGQRRNARPGGHDEQKVKPPRAIPEQSNPSAAAALDKPTTMGGAMKALIRNQTRFTGVGLRNLLLADKDYARLLNEYEPGALTANLRYWAKQGYLRMEGETPLEATFTVVDREWFS